VNANMQRYSMPSSGIYDHVAGWFFRSRYQAIADEIAALAPPDNALLDAGCGPGEVLVRLAKAAPSLRLTGLDVDAPMIARARRKADRALPAGTKRPTFVVADAAAMPFEDATFDLVVSSFAVHHWPDPHAGLAEVMRVLKSGGKAIIWDIAGPADHRAPAPVEPDQGHAATHGGSKIVVIRRPETSAPSGPSWLTALRMLLAFRKAVPQRFELVKP
jgi:ubiquinone/menaquinone biosynthesis C-methylase UbiE